MLVGHQKGNLPCENPVIKEDISGCNLTHNELGLVKLGSKKPTVCICDV